jgi:hypothetical protein
VLGHAPLLTGNDLRHNAINLSFDARVLDQDWVKTVLDGIGMMMNWDQAGAFDHAKLVHLGTALLSPGIAEEATVDQGKSQVNIYKEVTDALQKIMSGFKPVLVEQDASSQAKLQLVQQLLQQNTELQRRVMPVTPDGQINPAFNQAMAENLQIYVKHLEFNVQEMVTSKIQGRLGVASVQGSPAEMK